MNRALLVGIDAYQPPSQPLQGCVQDAKDMENFLVSNWHFETSRLPEDNATKPAIIDGLRWLLNGVKPGDRIVFYYSGNGGKVRTRNPTAEPDGYDEIICPVNFLFFHDDLAIRDKELGVMFRGVPKGVNFIWISDCCYSGGLAQDSAKLKSKRIKALTTPDSEKAGKLDRGQKSKLKGFHKTASRLNLAFISACRSDQTSQCAIPGRPNSALTYYLLKALSTPDGRHEPLTELIGRVRRELKHDQLEQEPQLVGASSLLNKPFLA
jgi:hypothetical protein